MSELYFNEERDFSEEDICDNEVFCSAILYPFQFKAEQKKTCNESHEKATKHIHADLLHIRTGNLHWCKGRPCKNKGKK